MTRSIDTTPTLRSGSVEQPLPVLVFAFARAQGTDLDPIRAVMRAFLVRASFAVADEVSLDAELWRIVLGRTFRDESLKAERERAIVMQADRARALGGSDVLARLGRDRIRERAASLQESARAVGAKGICVMLSHLAHPDEVHFLRREFGASFFLISVFEKRIDRRKRLISRYVRTGRARKTQERLADEILEITEGLVASRPDGATSVSSPDPPDQARNRINLKDTFPLADLFIRVGSNPPRSVVDVDGNHIEHFLERRSEAKLAELVLQIAGYPFATPDTHEMGMAHAYLARASSSSLGRQVGAAIVAREGDLIATGWNEVPSPRSGVYRQHYAALPLEAMGITADEPGWRDFRDHMLEEGSVLKPGDSNSRIRFDILVDLLQRLRDLDALDANALTALSQHITDEEGEFAWATSLLSSLALKGSLFSGMLEYGRSVHAEMNALTTAARRGIPVRDATMYVTTFPCHECARHIIASGVKRVFYIEPFGKSRVFELHGDAVYDPDDLTDASRAKGSIEFASFIGFSPWRHEDLFSMVHRKAIDQRETTVINRRDLWRVAGWNLDEGRLRPAFRPHLDGEPFAGKIEDGLNEILRSDEEHELIELK